MTFPLLCLSQPHFNKLMRRKWLSSPEALDGIVGTLGAQALALRRMQDEPYQVRLLAGRGLKQELSAGGTPAMWGARLSGCDRWHSAWGLRGAVCACIGVQGVVLTGLEPLVGGAPRGERARVRHPLGPVAGV